MLIAAAILSFISVSFLNNAIILIIKFPIRNIPHIKIIIKAAIPFNMII